MEKDGVPQYTAMQALKNAFLHDFSALVNSYLAAAEGLDLADLELQLEESTSVLGRDMKADKEWEQDGSNFPSIHSSNGKFSRPHQHKTLVEAMQRGHAICIWVQGEAVLERRDGEWRFIEGEKEV